MKEWIEKYYQVTIPEERQKLLEENMPSEKSKVEVLIEKLWVQRYGKGKPKNDRFIGCLMDLKFIYESGRTDMAGKRKQATKILSGLGLIEIAASGEEEKEILFSEYKNTFRRFIEISKDGRGFTSVLFGFGHIKDEGVVKKIADQISIIAFGTPHMLKMEKEFDSFTRAALEVYRETFPNREHLLKKY